MGSSSCVTVKLLSLRLSLLGGWWPVGGFVFRGPIGLVVKHKVVTRLDGRVPSSGQVVVAFNNKDIGGGNICSRIGRTLGSCFAMRF